MKKSDIYLWKFVRYIRRTYKNKLLALALILIGILMTVFSNDITVLVFISLTSIPLFFAKDNLTYL